MGLPKAYIQFLIREHKRQPFAEPVVILGRQYMYATFDEVRELMRREGVTPAAIDEHDARTNIDSWKGTPLENNISDVAFFRMLGLTDIHAADVSGYEGADIIMDLNRPAPPEQHNRFGLVVDGGTLEHVFDIRQALSNVARMVKPGGRAIHFSPMNNFVNHGFYQFSPTLFFDYYRINQFHNLKGWVVELPRYGWNAYARRIFRISSPQPRNMISAEMLENIFLAEKTAQSTVDKIPTQSYYDEVFTNGATTFVAPVSSWYQALRDRTPPAVKQFLIRYVRVTYVENRLPVWLKSLVLRFVPGVDKRKKPWGLKKDGRLG